MTSHDPSLATDERFLYLGTSLLLFVGLVHLLRAVSWLLNPIDPYPPALIVGMAMTGLLAIVIAAGIETTLLRPRTGYLAGIGLMIFALAAYADVHALGLLDAALPFEMTPSASGGYTAGQDTFAAQDRSVPPTRVLTDHLSNNITALLTKLVEFVTLISLLIAALLHGVDV